MALSRRGKNNSLEDRTEPQDVVLGVCRYVGMDQHRLRVYYFEGHGYWVAPYGYKLISKRGADVSLRRLNVEKKRIITVIGPRLDAPLEARLKYALMNLNGDERFYDRRIKYSSIFDVVGYYTVGRCPVKIYNLGIDGQPELTGEAFDKGKLDTIVNTIAIPQTQRSIKFLERQATIGLEDASRIIPICPTLLTKEDVS